MINWAHYAYIEASFSGKIMDDRPLRSERRVFYCTRCDHHMRLSGALCGRCGAPKALWQRPGVLITLGVAALLGIVKLLSG